MLGKATGPADRWSRRDYRTALRALRRLLADPSDTRQVFTIVRTLAGRSVERGYNRLLNTASGGRIAYERAELLDFLTTPCVLAAHGDETVGAALHLFLEKNALSPTQLMRKSRQGLTRLRNEIPHPYAWFGRRVRDTHDVWHVLTGYDTDPLGEACLSAFSFAQTGGLGWAAIAGGAVLSVGRTHGHPMRRAILEGYLLGTRAKWLLGEDYPCLLGESLVKARRRLGLEPAEHYARIPPPYRQGRGGGRTA